MLPRNVFYLYHHWRELHRISSVAQECVQPVPSPERHPPSPTPGILLTPQNTMCSSPYVITVHCAHPLSSRPLHHLPTVTASADPLTQRLPVMCQCAEKTTGGGPLHSNYTECGRISCMCTEMVSVLYFVMSSLHCNVIGIYTGGL